ncbi:hypothetical protein SKAU_G00054150 [Synaphobranchus kaupii]|uniref:Uncharacterized protein n=1 Tax=Synaphobranchus kaupii TaxID=118154 RepID=A0A9Q1JA26_SYNKA|nr:hypothetical protein SKAU_G00054150 [Synaphobranchus kaupii]
MKKVAFAFLWLVLTLETVSAQVVVFLFLLFVAFLVNKAWCEKSSQEPKAVPVKTSEDYTISNGTHYDTSLDMVRTREHENAYENVAIQNADDKVTVIDVELNTRQHRNRYGKGDWDRTGFFTAFFSAGAVVFCVGYSGRAAAGPKIPPVEPAPLPVSPGGSARHGCPVTSGTGFPVIVNGGEIHGAESAEQSRKRESDEMITTCST